MSHRMFIVKCFLCNIINISLGEESLLYIASFTCQPFFSLCSMPIQRLILPFFRCVVVILHCSNCDSSQVRSLHNLYSCCWMCLLHTINNFSKIVDSSQRIGDKLPVKVTTNNRFPFFLLSFYYLSVYTLCSLTYHSITCLAFLGAILMMSDLSVSHTQFFSQTLNDHHDLHPCFQFLH